MQGSIRMARACRFFTDWTASASKDAESPMNVARLHEPDCSKRAMIF